MTATTATQELQGEILKTVRKSQEFVVDAIQAWADAVQAIKPPLPDVNIPFTDKLPQPGEFVAECRCGRRRRPPGIDPVRDQAHRVAGQHGWHRSRSGVAEPRQAVRLG